MTLKARRGGRAPAAIDYCLYVTSGWPQIGGIGSVYDSTNALVTVYATMGQVSSYFQSLYPGSYGGESFYGSTANSWIVLNSTQSPPAGYQIQPDSVGPLLPLDFYPLGCDTSYICARASFTVPDAATWYPYLFISGLGSNENLYLTTYDDPGLQAAFTNWVLSSFGPQATGTISVVGNNVNIQLTGILSVAVPSIRSTDFGINQDDNFAIVPCP